MVGDGLIVPALFQIAISPQRGLEVPNFGTFPNTLWTLGMEPVILAVAPRLGPVMFS